jgi:hypothetical protein
LIQNLSTQKNSEEERELLREIWRLLGAETPDEEILVRSIRNFVCIILNFDKKFLYFPDMDAIDNKQFDENTIGIISREGVFYIKDRREIQKIHKSFYIFCMNRFNNMASKKSSRYRSASNRSNKSVNEFVPKINKKSKQIDKKRNALSTDPRYKILLKAGRMYHQNKKTKSIERQEEEAQKHTFHPQLNYSSVKKSHRNASKNCLISMSSEAMAFDNSLDSSKYLKGRQDEDKFLKELNNISPINKNAKKLTGKYKKVQNVNLPYKPIPQRHDKKPSLSNKNTQKKPSTSRNKPLGRVNKKVTKTKKTMDTQGIASENYSDEVLFKTESSDQKGDRHGEDIRDFINQAANDVLDKTKMRINELEKKLKAEDRRKHKFHYSDDANKRKDRIINQE